MNQRRACKSQGGVKHGKTWTWALLIGALTPACRKGPPPEALGLAVPANTQVLSHFQMQDIQAGTKYMVLDAEEGKLFENPAITKLQKPTVTFYKNGAVTSVLKAPEGRILMDTHEVLAWGGVVMTTADSTTLTTERMNYYPQSRRLFSNDPVRLEKPDSVTIGQGMESDVDLSHIKIGHEKVIFKTSKNAKAGS